MDSEQDNRRVIADIGGSRFEWGSRTYVMGIINTTPDSFSGDGLGTDRDQAVAQGLRMVREGADMLDVGGESTRPGHTAVDAADEILRVVPVVAAGGRLAKTALVCTGWVIVSPVSWPSAAASRAAIALA